MDIEKLRKSLLENSDPDGPCIEDDLMQAAATALSTLQAENERLRAELENYRKGHCSEGGCAAEKDRDAVLAELEQVKRERDAAIRDLEMVSVCDTCVHEHAPSCPGCNDAENWEWRGPEEG